MYKNWLQASQAQYAHDLAGRTIDGVTRERDDLRAEIERLNDVVERAKQAYKAWEEVAHEKEAENERLRTAIRLALQYMTAGEREFVATADDAQAAVDSLLAAHQPEKEQRA